MIATTSPKTFVTSPSPTADLTRLSATELAALIARGEASAAEAVEACIARIEAVNAKLNAVVVKRYNAARAEAREADARRARREPLGPLHGVPVTVKESLDLAGTPATFGLPSRAAASAVQDERHVARLRQAGAIVLGKTNVAQLLFYYESDNPAYGRTANPWDVNRTPGGSSGGQAAIIAAGGSPLGLGTDIGGSLRVPATFCGIASLKPTAGRTPDLGRFSIPLGQQAIPSQVGPLARTVDDVALGLEVINGANVEPPIPLGDYRAVDVSKLRVAFYAEDGTFAVAPAVRRAVREAAEFVRSVGAQTTEWTPPEAPRALDLLYGIFAADGGARMKVTLSHDQRAPQIATLLGLAGLLRPMINLLGGLLRTLGQAGLADGIRAFGHHDTAHYWGLAEAVMDYQKRFGAALDQAGIDAIICPANALPAWTHGASRDLITAGAYAGLYNVLGYPAGVVPFTRVRADEALGRQPSRDMVEQTAFKVEQGSAGLPVGVQVVARPWREHVALALMNTIEREAQTRSDYPQTPVMQSLGTTPLK